MPRYARHGGFIEPIATRGAIRTIAFLGNHTPRQCGIATFTADLCSAVALVAPELDCFVVAMNDAGRKHAYPDRVRFEVAEADLAAYQRAADFINVSDVDVVSVQHEYGIFGGDAGALVLPLLRDLRMPVVTTLHTIRAEPSPAQRVVMDELCSLSERLVVMSTRGRDLLTLVHGVPVRKIDLIPHGIASLPDATRSKSKLGVSGKQVLLTFGLLSPDKGIEYVIDALPAIVKRYPDVVYIVLGATHPHVRERSGEAYRLMLQARAYRLGVEDHVVFHDRFVSNLELSQFLAAADIYLTPYLNTEQITSGTLAYAVGSGKAVISTPYRYAEELLAGGRGVLVPPRDGGAVAREVLALLEDPARKRELERQAAGFGREMEWPVVARAYLSTFDRAASAATERRARSSHRANKIVKRPALPEVNLSHLRAMTDDTGILQHAAFSVPRYEDGYCLDDNARALLLLSFVEDAGLEPPASIRLLATRYLAFVRFAFDPASGRFRNFLSFARTWTEPLGSEDCHGRAIWALGTVLARSSDLGRRGVAEHLFHAALPASLSFTSPRAWAYTLLGLGAYFRGGGGDGNARRVAEALAERLLRAFRECDKADWHWFEDSLTYGNARLSQAMLVSGPLLRNDEMTAVGLQSLGWLAKSQRSSTGLFAPVGSDGFFERGGKKAGFDQQPIEACGMVSACCEAHRLTGDGTWGNLARHAFDWFLGQNELDRWLYDASTGGCRDGLHPGRPNENQGAESTLSFLTSLMEMRLVDQPKTARPAPRTRGPLAAGTVSQESLS